MPSHDIRALILGQFLAQLIAITAVTSASLAQKSLSFPVLQLSGVYLCLALIHGYQCFRQGHVVKLTKPFWQYFLMSTLDVEANVLVITAFKYTSITSITLLDCWAIPASLVLTRTFGLAEYKRAHYQGAFLCVFALFLLIITDSFESHVRSSLPLLGNSLVLLGATAYAASNVIQEHMLDDIQPSELLFALGSLGFIESIIQGYILELDVLLSAPWHRLSSWNNLFLIAGFVAAMVLFYSLVPYQLQWGGAALLNLSLLSSDLWVIVARILLFGGFSWVSGLGFSASFILVCLGLWIYTMSGPVKDSQQV